MTASARRPVISAVVHTRNEAHNLPACLESLKFADEIVVVDNESTDNTVALAKKAGVRVRHFKGNFGYPEPARAYGLTQLKGDWVFILDADERATPELARELARLARDPQGPDGYLVPIKNFHFGKWLRHGGLYPDLHLRFFKRTRGGYPEVGIHRGIHVSGAVGRVAQDILHYSYRSLEHYFEKFDRYTTAEAERLVSRGQKPTGYDLILKPLHRFIKTYIFKGGWRDALPGFLYHVFSAAYIFASELKAWDSYRQKGEFLPVGGSLLKRKR
ncbi:MAG: glycosyltransferase family 2 protein [Candidatus Firestonebacteria bacterium]|nr:glycosyltransferase family 2 protein [Candidatus Firestonebacteria bacterium]